MEVKLRKQHSSYELLNFIIEKYAYIDVMIFYI